MAGVGLGWGWGRLDIGVGGLTIGVVLLVVVAAGDL